MRTSVLIVDDHEPFRQLARALLQAEGFEVVGEAEDGASALEAVRHLRPNLVVLDVQLPDVDGFEIAERIAAGDGSSAVVLVSSRDESAFRRRLAQTSAVGFIGKGDLTGDALRKLLV
jgi:DNA-binding NarL/FixJ family response regulator